MTNERKTETITRELLDELHYYDSESITVEEQSSDFKNIKKLLSKALIKKRYYRIKINLLMSFLIIHCLKK